MKILAFFIGFAFSFLVLDWNRNLLIQINCKRRLWFTSFLYYCLVYRSFKLFIHFLNLDGFLVQFFLRLILSDALLDDIVIHLSLDCFVDLDDLLITNCFDGVTPIWKNLQNLRFYQFDVILFFRFILAVSSLNNRWFVTFTSYRIILSHFLNL
jgi:hypothetical protein